MIAPVIALLLSATTPRALPDASLVLHAPRVDKLSSLNGYLDKAGARTGLLRPNAWRSELSPLLDVDLTRSESVASAGLDGDSAVTVSMRGEDRVSCATVKDTKKFDAHVKQRLAGMGAPWKGQAKGAQLVGVTVHEKVTQGYAMKGREVCTVSAPKNVEALLRSAADALSRTPSGKGWTRMGKLSGVVFAVQRDDVLGFRAQGDTLVADGLTSQSPVWPLAKAPEGRYAGMTPSGMLFARFKLAGLTDTADAFAKKNLRACSFCDAATNDALGEAATLIAKVATGHGVVRVDRLDLKGSLRSQAGRYFALKNALALELGEVDGVKKALDRLESVPGAKKVEGGWELQQRDGLLRLSLKGKHLLVSNDAKALEALASALPAAGGKQAHAADLWMDAQRLNAALGQVNLLDVMGSQELAALFAAGMELGPLLGITEGLTGWADVTPDGYRLSFSWDLR